MPKFRKKPVVVEAQQWFPGKEVPGVTVPDSYLGVARPFVVTIHGQKAYLDPGDWIIPEPDGEHFYPCKPDIFEQTYEPVDKSGGKSLACPMCRIRIQMGGSPDPTCRCGGTGTITKDPLNLASQQEPAESE